MAQVSGLAASESSAPATTLRNISPSNDAAAIAACNVAAFHGDKHWRHQYAGYPAARIESDTASRTPWTLTTSRHQLRCLLAIDSAGKGEVVAYARWILPPSMVGNDSIWSEAVVEAEVSEVETRAAREAFEGTVDPATGSSRGLNRSMIHMLGDLLGQEDGRVRARFPDREFLELDYLAVRPDMQGRGLGKMLVRLGMDKARELGCGFIIMAFTEGGRRLYAGVEGLEGQGVIRLNCERWVEGREEGCECVAEFFVGCVHG